MLELPELWLTDDDELLDESSELDDDEEESSVLDELFDVEELPEVEELPDVDELLVFDEVAVDVAPQRISDATPVMPMLRMLMVAVRFLASFLPLVRMSTMWPHSFAWIRLVRHHAPASFLEEP